MAVPPDGPPHCSAIFGAQPPVNARIRIRFRRNASGKCVLHPRRRAWTSIFVQFRAFHRRNPTLAVAPWRCIIAVLAPRETYTYLPSPRCGFLRRILSLPFSLSLSLPFSPFSIFRVIFLQSSGGMARTRNMHDIRGRRDEHGSYLSFAFGNHLSR